jgi:hypothetical protein
MNPASRVHFSWCRLQLDDQSSAFSQRRPETRHAAKVGSLEQEHGTRCKRGIGKVAEHAVDAEFVESEVLIDRVGAETSVRRNCSP